MLGLDGLGGAERFADYSQWDVWQRSRQAKGAPNLASGTQRSPAAVGGTHTVVTKKKLSYIEAREISTIEKRIAEAEQELHAKRAALEDPAITSDTLLLQTACAQMEEAQKTVDNLYVRWAGLEQKKG